MIPGVELVFAREADVPPDDAWLTMRERDVLQQLRFEKRRRDWRLGRWAAHQVARIIGFPRVEVVAAADGAPEFVGTTAVVSISHSNGFGMAAASLLHDRLGCDVETIAFRSREFVQIYFNPNEIAQTTSAEIANAIWSAKESVLKATRLGLRADTRSVAIHLHHGSGWQRFDARFGDRNWQGWWQIEEGRVHTIVAA